MTKVKHGLTPIWLLTVYSVLFYGTWTIFHFFIQPVIDSGLSENAAALINHGLIKNTVWTFPAVLLIVKYNDSMEISLREMFRWKKENNKYLLALPAIAAYIMLTAFIKGGISVNDSFGVPQLILVLFVGVTEELAFRGWLLNATLKRNENAAIAVNALMFLTIHFPKWITDGVFIANFASLGFVSIIGLSVVFSLIFIKTKNIVLPIALHMLWDLLVLMFI